AMPKFARVMPELAAIADQQLGLNPPAAVKAGETLGVAYSMNKAVMHAFSLALVYVKSYGSKTIGNELKTFYKSNQKDVDAAITAIDTALASNVMPDFGALALRQEFPAMTAAYEAMAKSELSLTKSGAVEGFKGTLNLVKEPKVTNVPE